MRCLIGVHIQKSSRMPLWLPEGLTASFVVAASVRPIADRSFAAECICAHSSHHEHALQDAGVSPVVRAEATILQLNIGLYCNQACSHCHVESSPKRTEMMDRRTADRCLEVLRASPSVRTLDITGGAPELNSQFRYLVEQASQLGVEVIDRCNLTVLLEPGQEDLADFLAQHKVRPRCMRHAPSHRCVCRCAASPECMCHHVRRHEHAHLSMTRQCISVRRACTGARRRVTAVLQQGERGQAARRRRLPPLHRGTAATQRGRVRPHGQPPAARPRLQPRGSLSCPPQADLEPAYKRELKEAFDIDFDALLCLNNMPIKRYWEYLERRGELEEYMRLVVDSFNGAAGEDLMCRSTVSVAWDGSMCAARLL